MSTTNTAVVSADGVVVRVSVITSWTSDSDVEVNVDVHVDIDLGDDYVDDEEPFEESSFDDDFQPLSEVAGDTFDDSEFNEEGEDLGREPDLGCFDEEHCCDDQAE